MAFELKMPQLGLTMEEGTLSKWIKHEGDTVKAGDVVREIAKLAGGGGGGRPDSAMAGCKNVDKLPDAMAQAAALVRDMIQ